MWHRNCLLLNVTCAQDFGILPKGTSLSFLGTSSLIRQGSLPSGMREAWVVGEARSSGHAGWTTPSRAGGPALCNEALSWHSQRSGTET